MGEQRDYFGRTLDEGARETLRDVLINDAVVAAPECESCNGTGRRTVIRLGGMYMGECEYCDGRGRLMFKLSSGREASYYIDVARISQCEPGFSAIATIVAAEAWSHGCIQLGGVIAGGVPLALAGMYGMRRYGTNAARAACAFMVRDGAKEHGAGGAIAGTPARGQQVMLVEDVVSTGKSLANALFQCYEAGLVVRHCFALVDRGKESVQDLLREVHHDHAPAEVSCSPGESPWRRPPTYSYALTMQSLGIEDAHPSSETAP